METPVPPVGGAEPGADQGQEPGVAVVVGVLRVTTGADSAVGGDTGVDGVDGAESVGVHLMVGEGARGAWLEGGVVTSCIWVESVNATEHAVGVDARAAIIGKVGENVRTRPECLQEAQDLGRLRRAVRAGRADGRCKGSAFNERAVLDGDSKKRRATNLLPQIYLC